MIETSTKQMIDVPSPTEVVESCLQEDGRVETLHRRWSARWSSNRTGWHKKQVHPALLKYLPEVLANLKGNDTDNLTILVPLCGKAVELSYFTTVLSSSKVVGVDGVQQAIDEFITENKSLEIILKPAEEDTNTKFSRFIGTNIELLCGDFFDLASHDITSTGGDKFDFIWDRASMVAIEPTLRESYVLQLSELIRPGGSILLVAWDRRSGTKEAKSDGPPFSFNEAEVRAIFEKESWVETVKFLGEIDELAEDPASKDRWAGLTELFEMYFVIQAKL